MPPPTTPSPQGPAKNSLGDRRLAAIVFTDVANFSALVEKDEPGTILLVQRDLKLIGDVCRKYGGEVLKNTGDGCLVAFSSVESAVGAAIKIQRLIADSRNRLPPEQVLRHRIGIHLGDVFFGQGDVLGNGVNIAARLLGEAEPDGICISQAVYDLVKHRLNIKAVSIGARELKHIREAVQAYRLIIDAVADDRPEKPAPKPAPRKNWIIPAAAAFALVAIGVAAWFIIHSAGLKPSDTVVTSDAPPAPAIVPIPPATAPAVETETPAIVLQTLQRKPDFSIDSDVMWKRFRVFSNDMLSAAVLNNAYMMTVHTNLQHIGISATPWGSFDNVTISATAQIRGTPLSSWGLQLISAQGARKMIRTTIGVDGALKVDLRSLNGVDKSDRPANPDDLFIFKNKAIHLGQDLNTLVIDVHNQKLLILVNGQKVGTIWDITPLGPATLDLFVEANQESVAGFKELKVWMPPMGK